MRIADFNPYTAWTMAIDPEATGRAWRQKRLALGLTQDQLALIFELAELGTTMSKAAISAVEHGKHTPSIHHAMFFAGLCGCPVEDLVVTFGRSRDSEARDRVAPSPKFHIYNKQEHPYEAGALVCT